MKLATQTKSGITITQKNGPFVEVTVDFLQLPSLNLEQEHFQLEWVPNSPLLPKQRMAPSSSGPLFFNLQEGVPYQLYVIRREYFSYQVQSKLSMQPHVDLIEEQEGFYSLTWGNMDLETLQDEFGARKVILTSGDFQTETDLFEAPKVQLPFRPDQIQATLEGGHELFTVQTNLRTEEIIEKIDFQLPAPSLRLHAFSARSSERGFKVRAELSRSWDMDQQFRSLLKSKAGKLKQPIVGFLFEDAAKNQHFQRQYGWSTQMDEALIRQIQKEELGYSRAATPKEILCQIQITTAHRELYKEPIHTHFSPFKKGHAPLEFTAEEILEAKAQLFRLNPYAEWDHSLVELVFFFPAQDGELQEFQREIAQSYRYDYWPDQETPFVSVSLVAQEAADPKNSTELLPFGAVQAIHPAPRVALKPFSSHQIMAYWELEPKGVREFIYSEWKVGLEEVGFYLKIHEEYLGKRTARPDLEIQITELFNASQNQYLQVEPNRRFVAELVARHHHMELAMTPISNSIQTPRDKKDIPTGVANARGFEGQWHHPTQRQVAHLSGGDEKNQSKVMMHLHMHSPNLMRAEQFREGFLKASPWPILTSWGAEVHNTPGEWAYKNCLDSWLPILRSLLDLRDQGVDYQISIDITPPVAYMISHPKFKDYMSRYLKRSMAHTQTQIAHMKARLEPPELIWAGECHLDWIKEVDHFYNHSLQKDMIAGFRSLELTGHLELSTCTATHGMPANLENSPNALTAQIEIAAMSHERIFGSRPKGIWLAENSCFPGVGEYIEKAGMHYYFVEAEAILQGSTGIKEEEFNPVLNPGGQVVSFGRNRMGRVQVWDAEIGYAGHPDFREYHHRHWGLPLKRITSKTSEEKAPYNPDQAKATAQALGRDFYDKLCQQADEFRNREMTAEPLITCTYDAELFGHHWFEGPWFLEELLREFHRKSDYVGLTTPSHYLADHKTLPELMPNPSTWGHDACHVKWNDPQVAWAQRELDLADDLLVQYLGKAIRKELSDFHEDCVGQMAKELLRAQSSDLTFVIMSGDFEEDMQREILKFLDYFYRLKALIDLNIKDSEFLNFRLYENDMFPELTEHYRLRQG